MAETIESTRRWSGFVCPDCRFIFRVPRDHDGQGVVCPSCRRMLRIPSAGEVTPPLVQKAGLSIVPVSLPESFQRQREKRQEEGSGAPPEVAAGPEMVAKRRRREPKPDEAPGWEKAEERRVRVGGRSRPKVGRWIAVALAALSLVGAVLILMRREKKPAEPVVVKSVRQDAPEVDFQPAEEIELPFEMNRNEVDLLAELEPLAKTFLNARSVDEMLPLVRDRAKVEKKMRDYYKKGSITPPGLGQFNTFGTVAYRGKLASVGVRTGDFESKQLAFIRTKDGMKIDWESYVGWCGMDWKDFVNTKPSKPVLFRAALKAVDYYNFDFSDELDWKCYQLSSDDHETVVYGYVKRGSEMDRKLQPSDPNGTTLVTVRLKYPPGAKQKNQVLIDSVVADGWVEGIE